MTILVGFVHDKSAVIIADTLRTRVDETGAYTDDQIFVQKIKALNDKFTIGTSGMANITDEAVNQSIKNLSKLPTQSSNSTVNVVQNIFKHLILENIDAASHFRVGTIIAGIVNGEPMLYDTEFSRENPYFNFENPWFTVMGENLYFSNVYDYIFENYTVYDRSTGNHMWKPIATSELIEGMTNDIRKICNGAKTIGQSLLVVEITKRGRKVTYFDQHGTPVDLPEYISFP